MAKFSTVLQAALAQADLAQAVSKEQKKVRQLDLSFLQFWDLHVECRMLIT
jgi:hypothetical protein